MIEDQTQLLTDLVFKFDSLEKRECSLTLWIAKLSFYIISKHKQSLETTIFVLLQMIKIKS